MHHELIVALSGPLFHVCCVLCAGREETHFEAHMQDYCSMIPSIPGLDDSPDSGDGYADYHSVCETEVSLSLCPPGWVYYKDHSGSEGHDSCIQVSRTLVSRDDVESGLASCAPGSHLLTVRGPSPLSGLLLFAAGLSGPEALHVGCSQQSTAGAPLRGWTWTDGTSATNLNCGDGQEPMCGVWQWDEPKCVHLLVDAMTQLEGYSKCYRRDHDRVNVLCSDGTGSGTEQHIEDFCKIDGGYLMDGPSETTATLLCETEVSDRCPHGWAFYADDGSEGGVDSCVQLSSYAVASWDDAEQSCPGGSHLLTVNSGDGGVLLAFATSLYPTTPFFIGCSQAGEAPDALSGWSWVDITPSTNLNCGQNGCGVWDAASPE